MDAGAAGQCHLGHEVGGATEAVDPEPTSLGKVGPQQGPVADDPGAQEGSRLHVVEHVGERVGVGLLHHRVRRVPPVEVPAGEAWPEAQVLAPGKTETADPAGVGQPGHPDAVALAPARGPGPESVDDPDDLVTRRHPGAARRQVALGEVEVRPAHTAGPHAYAYFTRSWFGNGPLHPHQRVPLAVDWAGLVDLPRLHDLCHCHCHSA